MAEYIKPEKDRYIKLSQALEVLDSCACWWAHDQMELIPAADVQPVVRCKDCRHNRHCLIQDFIEDHGVTPDEQSNFFCGYGEREKS